MRESLNTLPTEVIEEIMSYISYGDISTLAQTSKRLWQVAAPRLPTVIPLLTPERMRNCIQRLAEDPQRAAPILEIHIRKLILRRKPFPWGFETIGGFLVATLERLVPLPFLPVETYPELSRVFNDALRNMTCLRILVIHSRQTNEILGGDVWDCNVTIPSLRKIFVYPGAESSSLWRWVMRQRSLTTLRVCWKHTNQPWWNMSAPKYRGPSVFAELQTLITDPEGATEILPKSVVSDLTIQSVVKRATFSEYPTPVPNSHWADTKPPFLYDIVRSNERTPLRRITLSGTVEGICSVLSELQSRDSLPPHVRMFFEFENEKSERDLVRSSSSYTCTQSQFVLCPVDTFQVERNHPHTYQCGGSRGVQAGCWARLP